MASLARPTPDVLTGTAAELAAKNKAERMLAHGSGLLTDCLSGAKVGHLPGSKAPGIPLTASFSSLGAAIAADRASAAAAAAWAATDIGESGQTLRVGVPVIDPESKGGDSFLRPGPARPAALFDRGSRVPRALTGAVLERDRLASDVLPASVLSADEVLQLLKVKVHLKPAVAAAASGGVAGALGLEQALQQQATSMLMGGTGGSGGMGKTGALGTLAGGASTRSVVESVGTAKTLWEEEEEEERLLEEAAVLGSTAAGGGTGAKGVASSTRGPVSKVNSMSALILRDWANRGAAAEQQQQQHQTADPASPSLTDYTTHTFDATTPGAGAGAGAGALPTQPGSPSLQQQRPQTSGLRGSPGAASALLLPGSSQLTLPRKSTHMVRGIAPPNPLRSSLTGGLGGVGGGAGAGAGVGAQRSSLAGRPTYRQSLGGITMRRRLRDERPLVRSLTAGEAHSNIACGCLWSGVRVCEGGAH